MDFEVTWKTCDDHVTHTYVQVGNCVAKRNYRYFYLFLNTVLVMAIYVMGCNIAVIVIGKSCLNVCLHVPPPLPKSVKM